jgi:serine/threonine protein kinase/tetratricopeptide (TPR) repeat protein
MKPDEWNRVKAILNDCLDVEPGLRQARLDELCAGDSDLQREVQSLLNSYSQAGEDFLETAFLEPSEETFTGRQIGMYRIGEKIAEGGMGAVYRAVRLSDYEKQVAVKLVKRGMDTDFLLRRFRQERQILAALDHPNIARLLDGGATEDGRPYLVMDYIEGTPIPQFCDDHRLGEAERLKLFRTVCAAVQYAHQNLVVHRDLKAGNILVTPNGDPKLLDFGIAKLLEPDADATVTWMRMLSPDCASPEQVRGEAITTATDIYSLGVLLYRLLTGEPPYRFTTRTEAEITRVVCEDEPKKPSDLKSMHADLDNIVLKAMHKDPARRYASASQLSEDIQRYLDGLPVIARKDTFVYRLSKFVRRHTGASIAAGLALLSLLGGMAATLRQAHRTAVQQQITTAVNDFLRNDLLAQAGASRQAGPGTTPDPDLKVRTALDRAAARIEGKFAGQPVVEASIRQTIGEAYEDLGLYPQAERHVERALDLRRRILGDRDSETLASMNTMAGLLGDQGKYAEAEALQSKVVDLRRNVLGDEHPDTLVSMDGLANAYKHLGRYSDAETLQSKVLDVRRRTLGEEHPQTVASMNDLATIYEDEGKFAPAEQLLVRANDIERRVLGEEHPDTLIGMNNLASLYSRQGMFAKAEALDSKVLETRKRVLGVDHPLTLASMNNLAVEYARDGQYAQAEPLLVAVLEARRRVLGDGNPDTLLSMNNLAGLYRRQGKYAQAEPLFAKALETQGRLLGPDHPLTLASMNNLASLYQAERKYGQAEPLFLKALAGRRRILGPEHPDTLLTLRNLARLQIDEAHYAQAEVQSREAVSVFEKTAPAGWERYYAQCLLGESLAGQRKLPEAEPLLLAGYDGMKQKEASIPPANRPDLRQSGEWIVRLYERWNKQEKAATWRKTLASPLPPAVH